MTIMQEIQSAITATGIPAYQARFVDDEPAQAMPEKYATYQIYSYEDCFQDDEPIAWRHSVYLNLYGRGDPTQDVEKLRNVIRELGFSIDQEYIDADKKTRYYMASWELVGWRAR